MRLHARRFLAELSQLRLQGFAPLYGDFVLLLAECLALYLQLLYATLHRIYLHGHGVNFYAQTAGRLVHEVYGLVGEEAVAYVAVGEHGRRHPVSYTHLRAHETDSYLVCRLLLEKKKNK